MRMLPFFTAVFFITSALAVLVPLGHSDSEDQASHSSSDWRIEVVDSVGRVGHWTSIAVDVSDYPHISYHDEGNEDLKYAEWTGTEWNNETVDSIGDVGKMTSIALDRGGNPHISYYDHTNVDLKYARRIGGVWNITVVDFEGDVGPDSSIAIDSNDFPHISYCDDLGVTSDDNLKYARWNGSAWIIETVDSKDEVGGYASMVLDSSDNPHLSYSDYPNVNLKYATKVDLGPPTRSISLDIDPDTLNLKSKGRWITAYLSSENASVYDIDISSILLQDALAPERYDYQDDVLMLKFNREEFKDTIMIGKSVEVKISGKWEDGTEFEAYDYVRVIDPGGDSSLQCGRVLNMA